MLTGGPATPWSVQPGPQEVLGGLLLGALRAALLHRRHRVAFTDTVRHRLTSGQMFLHSQLCSSSRRTQTPRTSLCFSLGPFSSFPCAPPLQLVIKHEVILNLPVQKAAGEKEGWRVYLRPQPHSAS